MLTPQEVQEKTFEKAVFGGYDMGAVDDFLEPLTEDYISLYKENAVLKNKMKVLVDSIEEYRKTEEAIRAVLIGAQKTAEDIVEKAKADAENLKREAEKAALEKNRNLIAEHRVWEEKLQSAKKNTISYIDKMRLVYQKQTEFIEKLASADEHQRIAEETPPPAPPEPPEEKRRIINDSVQKIIEREDATLPAVKPTPAEEEENTSPKPTFEFIDLQFGKDYELK